MQKQKLTAYGKTINAYRCERCNGTFFDEDEPVACKLCRSSLWKEERIREKGGGRKKLEPVGV